MKILSVKAKNFRSYKDISWTLPTSGLTLLDGQNLDTGRSNMTGKTTLLDAIFWGLYGYLPKWGGPKGGPVDAVIHRGEKNCWVEVNVEHNGDIYQIVRRRPSSLAVVKNQGSIAGKTGDLDDRIPDLVGMTANQFLLSVYISQDRQTSFFTMTDTERTKLLSTIAGLEHLNRALEKSKALKDDIQKKLQTQDGAIQALNAQIARLPEERAGLEQTKAEYTERYGTHAGKLELYVGELGALVRDAEDRAKAQQAELESAKAQDLEKLNQEFTKVSYERMEKNSSIQALPKIEPEYAVRVSQARVDLKKAEDHNYEQLRAEASNLQTRIKIKHIAEMLEKGEFADSCEECGQALPNQNPDEKFKQLLDLAEKHEANLKPELPKIDIEPLKAALEEAQRQLTKRTTELESAPATLRQEVKMLDQQLAQIKRQSDMSTLDYDRKIANLNEEVKRTKADATQKEQVARMELDRILTQIESAQAMLDQCTKREKDLKMDLGFANGHVFDLNKQMDEVLDLIDLFGPKGFRAVCFDGIIERISDRAGQLLQLMTDHIYSSRIEQVGETAKGEERIQLRPVITKGGLEVPMDDLSGGARRMAMLAYDVAVSEAVGESSVLFLDEALDGLDAQGKAEAMRLLEEVGRTRGVILIDHASEAKAACQTVLKVTYQNNVSSLTGHNPAEETLHESTA